ncbi:hypothetical protein CSP68_003429 [Salmonella enterica subsp. diarizonae]|nr:hypothetical protein [Salmonella enterica subsp. diarizonae]EDQ7903634.1 hypothetical protein [Salmonella enterica subsp. diarizonae]
MRKTSIAIAIAMASVSSIGCASVAWDRTMKLSYDREYPISKRKTGKAAERRQAKRRRRAKK